MHLEVRRDLDERHVGRWLGREDTRCVGVGEGKIWDGGLFRSTIYRLVTNHAGDPVKRRSSSIPVFSK